MYINLVKPILYVAEQGQKIKKTPFRFLVKQYDNLKSKKQSKKLAD